MTLLLLLACAADPKKGPGADPGDDTAAPEEEDTAPPAPEAPTYSGGVCPTLVEGTNEGFMSGGEARTFELRLPANPEGAPVVFGWHWLGGNARQAIRYLELESLVEEQGAIVIAPDSCCSDYEWEFISQPEGNVDLALFDDALACLADQFAVDTRRVYATGMSAGGLWTSYLTVHRSQNLAATAIFSGGTTGVIAYTAPQDDIPVLALWGGPSDTYGPLSFETTTLGMTEDLVADGHFVVACDHDGGHTIPADPSSFFLPFFADHEKGQSPEPWAAGLPEGYPSICGIVTP
jgi:predicted esterase